MLDILANKDERIDELQKTLSNQSGELTKVISKYVEIQKIKKRNKIRNPNNLLVSRMHYTCARVCHFPTPSFIFVLLIFFINLFQKIRGRKGACQIKGGPREFEH